MKAYEKPTVELVTVNERDLITCSFGNLPELDDEGTSTPPQGFVW